MYEVNNLAQFFSQTASWNNTIPTWITERDNTTNRVGGVNTTDPVSPLASLLAVPESTAYIVVEHAPEDCAMFPSNGNITFVDIGPLS